MLVDAVAFALAALVTSPAHPVHVLVLPVNVAVFALLGLYRSRLHLSVLDDIPYLLAAVGVALTLEIGMFSVIPGVEPPMQRLVHSLVWLAALVASRTAAYAVVRRVRCSGRARHRTLVLGAGHVGLQLANSLLEHREYGLDPVGFVDSRPRVDDPSELPVPLLGGYEQLAQVIRAQFTHVVIVAFGGAREVDLVDVLRTCDRLDCEVFVVPRLFELHNSNRSTDEVWGRPLLRVRRSVFRTVGWRFKRLIDVVVAAVALGMLSPLLVLIAAAVRWEGGPGVLFRQERVSLDGRPFLLRKFRSLRPASDTEADTRWNIKHDERLEPVGRFLRATSLDELPQLWNILVGEMSLVGPRPERPHFVSAFAQHVPRYMARHRVPAGLTGWAQVHGLRGDTSIEDRARFDNYYIENWSLWLDVKIVLRTVEQVVRRRGA